MRMSHRPAGLGCVQLTRALRYYEEQPAAAVALNMLLPHFKHRPAACRNLQISPHIRTECRCAACALFKSAPFVPPGAHQGVSPFAPFAASVISNAASASDKEADLHRVLATLLSAGFSCLVINLLAPVLTAAWPHVMSCICSEGQNWMSCAASELRQSGPRLRAKLLTKLCGLLTIRMVQKVLELMEGHLTPEQLSPYRQVLNQFLP